MVELVGFELSMMYTMPLFFAVLVAIVVNVFSLYVPGVRCIILFVYSVSTLLFQSPIFVTIAQAFVTFRS